MKRFLALIFFLWSSVAFAQTVTPVLPGYNVCNTNSGSTQCGFIAVDENHPLPVTSSGGGNTTVDIDQTTPGTTNGVVVNSLPGTSNFATSQVTIATSNTSTVSARAGRRSVTITNITGTQPIYCSGTAATTGNGQFIPGVPGASFTTSTAAAINCIAVSSAQTVSVAEAY